MLGAVTFPRTLPDEFEVFGLSFYPDPMLEVTPLRSGRQIAKDLGPTLWRARYESPPIPEVDFGAWRAWHATLTSVEPFYGYDVLREYPLAYRDDGFAEFEDDSPPFDGTCDLADVENSKIVTLAGLPVGFVLSEGDYIAFDYGTNESRALHMVVQGGTMLESPDDLEIEVRPHVRVGWDSSPSRTVYLHRPAAKMLIVPGTYQESIDVNRMGKISFEAIQTL